MFVKNVGLLQNFTDYKVWLRVQNEMGSSEEITAIVKSAEASWYRVLTECDPKAIHIYINITY